MAARAAKLAELRALRAAGKTRISTYEVEEEKSIYEEVDEEGYKKVVRKRLDEDDFVVDDNGEGYADDGREEWDDERQKYSSESEEERPSKGKAVKRKRDEDREKKNKINNGISKYFNANAAVAASKHKPVATAEDAAFMADLLGEVDTNLPSRRPVPRTIKNESRRKTRVLSPPISKPKASSKQQRHDVIADSLPPAVTFDDDDGYMPVIDDDVPMSDPLPSSPVTKAVERKLQNTVKVEQEDDDEMMEVTQAVGHASANTASVNMAGRKPLPKMKKTEYPTPDSSSPTRPLQELDASALNAVTSKLNILSSPAPETASFGKLKPDAALEEDGSLRMFWLDYTEVNGSLCLFGKVKDKSTGNFVSCFVKVDNILRKLYFLPREYRQRHGRDTSEEVGMSDVSDEVDEIMARLRVDMHKIKDCTRKYAFELPGIPKEADYLKLLYPYTKPALSTDLRGDTFSHVFGANTALFEQFVLWKNIMGPCWLQIQGADFHAVNNASWCKLELQVTKPNLITTLPDSDNLEIPSLTLMSISLRTTFNAKDNKQEILVASARVYSNVSLTDTTPVDELPCKSYTVMRPYGNSYPIGFQQEISKHKGSIQMERNEMGLLSKFLAILAMMDPDVLMGHKLEDVDYTVLLNRMKERKTPGWHRIGRLKRTQWPSNMGKGGGSFFAERQLASGRLLCDLANDLGKSLMMKCQSWSLTEMCDLVLNKRGVRQDFDNENALKTWATDPRGLMDYVKHCEADTYFIAAIAMKVQMLPLSKVLTNLAGNSWARTLSGTRAERNEYILLHEFHRNKYISPDKVFGKPSKTVEDEDAQGEDGVNAKKKDKFKGGLVFEPEKGLYDKFILVMDFNSLYPSIIQEYNICFTTVERSNLLENTDQVPEVPGDQALGILPKLIATLVQRRRDVKKAMKDKTATADQIQTWDIKQLALKLTANSMYGCLGYTKSRFYARPLAMLTTAKGREILQSTKELAESNMLRVIYGDTDSVMINTNMDNIQDAMKVGNDFKRSVNERYRLLEIDIDNVFRRLLLHAKKKYAAINMIKVDDKYIEQLEVKGLDMRRREYCQLSKDTSSALLNFLLSGEDPETVVEKIHDYLRDLTEKMRAFSIPNHKYIIYTQLGKDPKDYPEAKSMPSVQVALRRMAKGEHIKAKDVMSFIITGKNDSSNASAAQNAFPPDDLKADPNLKPDVDYYLHKQILPPVERLCAPISGTDVTRLAGCLGLDTTKYRITSASSSSPNQDAEIQPLESQLTDEQRFQSAVPLSLRCPRCTISFVFRGLVNSPTLVSHQGITCPSSKGGCGNIFPNYSVIAQVEAQLRQQIARYYDAWLICTECSKRTRQMSVYGHMCLGPQSLGKGCAGRMSMQYEYTEKMMYNQLLYFSSLFDVDKAKEKVSKEVEAAKGSREVVDKAELVKVLADNNRERFGAVTKAVKKHLEKNGRQWVAMDSIFSFALKALS
ncbi:hypothetical protein M501DRAFT_993968 [Patellaria atrata CBS 101060]|uniref:DNA polymerase n=1 Tax=Patellaria atrata CBS 101060 TaxID=1346257 RepID=A0A9P4VWV4_9PEZI|nr:hypothetical protein M501DRAFT_993968 [Patellaria atrata CBS 101060]